MLPIPTRAAAFVFAVATTAAIVNVIAEIGHPSPTGEGVAAWLSQPQAARRTLVHVARTTAVAMPEALPGAPQP